MLDARIPDGLADLRASWTMTDLCIAHDLLDELDRAEARAHEAMKAGRR